MRLAVVLATLEPGGAQLCVLRVTEALRARGVESRVLVGEATSSGRTLFARAGVPIEVWGGGTGLQYGCDEEWAEWLAPRLAGADVVHGHMFGAWWAAGRAAAPGVPLVASEHNAVRWPGPPRARAYSEGLRRVGLMLAHGPAAAAYARERGLPAERLRPGRSPIEDVRAARPWPGLPPRRVVFAGRLHPEKGPDLLVEALARMPAAPPAVLVGGGPAEDALQALVRARGLAGRVTFAGWQARVAPWLAGAAACVVPSRHEAWSQTAVLAMALGVPVIGSAVEGLPATLGEGRGVLVEPDDPDALAAALSQVLAGRRPPVAPGRAYALRHTAAAVAAERLALYEELLAPVAEPPRLALAA